MSDAALRYVASLPPTMKGSARTLMTVIANLIPEGETTTPLIGMDALAAMAGCTRRTVLTRLQGLIDGGELAIVDGGSGRIARYTLVHLTGARPLTTAPLPLVGAAPRPRVSSGRIPPSPSTPDLLDLAEPVPPSDQTAINLRNFFTGWARVPVIFFHRLLGVLAQPAQIFHRLDPGKRSDGDQPVKKDHRWALPLAVDGTYVHTRSDVHTHARPRGEPSNAPDPKPPPCRWTGTAHAWCDGRVHVPRVLHGELVRKHARPAGETDTDVAAQLVAFYAARCAALPPDERIIGDDFQFWRRSYAAAFTVSPVRAAERPAPEDPALHAARVAAAAERERRAEEAHALLADIWAHTSEVDRGRYRDEARRELSAQSYWPRMTTEARVQATEAEALRVLREQLPPDRAGVIAVRDELVRLYAQRKSG